MSWYLSSQYSPDAHRLLPIIQIFYHGPALRHLRPFTPSSDILIASTPPSQYELALISWGGMPESKKRGFNRVSPYYLATLLLIFLIHSMKTANTNSPTSLSSIILQNSLTSSSSIRLHLLFIPLPLLSWPRPSPFSLIISDTYSRS